MSIEEVRVALDWFCGCGNPEEAMAVVADVLDCFGHGDDYDQDHIKFNELVPERLRMFVLYVLTDKDLLEHGGSVGGSWRTPEGDKLLEGIRQHPDAMEAENGWCMHGFDINDMKDHVCV